MEIGGLVWNEDGDAEIGTLAGFCRGVERTGGAAAIESSGGVKHQENE